MLAPTPARISLEQFLAWEAEQDEKWELVNGVPERRSDRWGVDPVTGMAGASRGHNRIVGNLLYHLRRRLGGGPCLPFPSDLKVISPTGNTRYPDVVVDCGDLPDSEYHAAAPTVLFEVTSPSLRKARMLQLWEDYQAMETLQCLVLIEQDRPEVSVFVRGDRWWPSTRLTDLGDIVPLPMVGTELPLSEIYERLRF